MLRQIIEMIDRGEVRDPGDISRRLGISVEMVRQMMEDLTNKGYLVEIVSGCAAPKSSCGNCFTNANCQTNLRFWQVTQKGQLLLS